MRNSVLPERPSILKNINNFDEDAISRKVADSFNYDNLDADPVPDVDKEEEFVLEKMYQDIFSATFYAMRKKYKKKYKLLTEDQTSYYFECMFILSIQVILFVSLYNNSGII
jgi:hypothetical protein